MSVDMWRRMGELFLPGGKLSKMKEWSYWKGLEKAG